MKMMIYVRREHGVYRPAVQMPTVTPPSALVGEVSQEGRAWQPSTPKVKTGRLPREEPRQRLLESPATNMIQRIWENRCWGTHTFGKALLSF
jgi:hypothetical protein